MSERMYSKLVWEDIKPIGKPRMTAGSVHSPAAQRYWKYKDNLNKISKEAIALFNEWLFEPYLLVFEVAMPPSWSRKKKEALAGKKMEQTPDKDNFEKAFLDALLKEDKRVYSGWVEKYWSDRNRIILYPLGKILRIDSGRDWIESMMLE